MKNGRRIPEESLQSGPLIFDPTSFLLFAEDYQEALGWLEQMVPGKDPSTEFTDKSAVLAHEQDHMLRFLSTSYGALRYAVNNLEVRFALESIGAHSSRETAPGPILQISKGRIVNFQSPATTSVEELVGLRQDHRFRYLSHYVGFQEIQRCFDGLPARMESEMVEFGLRLLLGYLSGESVPPIVTTQIRSSAFLSQFGQSIDSPRINDRTIGAFEILECLGYLMEVQISRSFKGTEDLLDRKLRDDLYSGTFRLFLDTVLEHKPYKGHGLPLEFEAALDLSLWIPITGRGLFGQDASTEWSVLHPGWRLLTIFELFIDHDWEWTEPEGESFGTLDKLTDGIQTRICEALGWPTVNQILDEWIDCFKNGSDVPYIHPHHPRLLYSQEMMEARYGTPFTLYLNDERSFGSPNSPLFPGMISDEIDVTIDADRWKDAKGRSLNWIDWYAINGSRLFIYGPEIYDELLDRHIDHAKLTLLSLVDRSDWNPELVRKYMDSIC